MADEKATQAFYHNPLTQAGVFEACKKRKAGKTWLIWELELILNQYPDNAVLKAALEATKAKAEPPKAEAKPKVAVAKPAGRVEEHGVSKPAMRQHSKGKTLQELQQAKKPAPAKS